MENSIYLNAFFYPYQSWYSSHISKSSEAREPALAGYFLIASMHGSLPNLQDTGKDGFIAVVCLANR